MEELVISLGFFKNLDIMYLITVSFIVSLICEKFISHFNIKNTYSVFIIYVLFSSLIIFLTFSDLSLLKLFFFNIILVTLISSFGSIMVQNIFSKRKDTKETVGFLKDNEDESKDTKSKVDLLKKD